MITKFKKLFSNFKVYTNEDLLMNKVTSDLLRQISYLLPEAVLQKARNYKGLGRIDTDSYLRSLCDTVSSYTNQDKTTNWGWDYIIKDFEDQIFVFKTRPFYKFMDAMSEIAINFFDGTIIEDLNDTFEENNFGYRLVNDEDKPWVCINPKVGMVVEIDKVIETTEELCKQAAEHIKQAREQITKVDNPRARKDAIRDCLSAMEALLKKLTDTKDIVCATEAMRQDENKWGPKIIVGDANKLWNTFHRQYRDIRHGDEEISNITVEQSMYFVDRILAFINYVARLELE